MFIFFLSAPLLSVPLFGGSATVEWITLSSSGVSVADSRGKTPRILQGNDNTIPRWVRKDIFSSCHGKTIVLYSPNFQVFTPPLKTERKTNKQTKTR